MTSSAAHIATVRDVTSVTAYKTTGPDGTCVYGKGVWRSGKWRTVSGQLIPCHKGIHYCTKPQLVHWLNAEVWTFEDGAPDTTIDSGDKTVTSRGRVVERVGTWNETTARLFAADCAESVLHIFEAVRPRDDRPRKAIEAKRMFARGEIDAAAADAAGAAAADAAAAAAWAAAGAAAWAAAGAAARDAARDAQTVVLFDYLEGRRT